MSDRYKILRGYSILGATDPDRSYLGSSWPSQAAIVVVDTIPHPRVFLGCAQGNSEDEILETVAGMGNELSFEFIEELYLMLKEAK